MKIPNRSGEILLSIEIVKTFTELRLLIGASIMVAIVFGVPFSALGKVTMIVMMIGFFAWGWVDGRSIRKLRIEHERAQKKECEQRVALAFGVPVEEDPLDYFARECARLERERDALLEVVATHELIQRPPLPDGHVPIEKRRKCSVCGKPTLFETDSLVRHADGTKCDKRRPN